MPVIITVVGRDLTNELDGRDKSDSGVPIRLVCKVGGTLDKHSERLTSKSKKVERDLNEPKTFSADQNK